MGLRVCELVSTNRYLATRDHGERCNARIQPVASGRIYMKHEERGCTFYKIGLSQLALHPITWEFQLLDQPNYNFEPGFVASTRLFLPPNPNRYAATLRIWISSLPSVILYRR